MLLPFVIVLIVRTFCDVIIENDCAFPFSYIILPTMISGTLSAYSTFDYPIDNRTGTSIKIYSPEDTSNIVQFEFALWQYVPMVTYDISLQNGNPFGIWGYSFVPSITSCGSLLCPPNNVSCAYTGVGEDINEQGLAPNSGCPMPVTLTGTVCGGPWLKKKKKKNKKKRDIRKTSGTSGTSGSAFLTQNYNESAGRKHI